MSPRKKDALSAEDRATPKPKDVWDKIQATSSLLTAVVVAVLGYWLTGSVDNALKRQEAALKRQELQLSNVREMKELLMELHKEEASEQGVLAHALTLSAFGRPAVGPLLSVLSLDDPIRRHAAEEGLLSIGMSEAETVCAALVGVINNRSGRFRWLTHDSALRLIGELECPRDTALPALNQFRALLLKVQTREQLADVAQVFLQEPPVDLAAIAQLRSQLDRTIKLGGR